MAVLTSEELAQLRRGVAQEKADIDWLKQPINGAFQALEDWFEGERTNVSNLIDAASAPHVFTNQQKKEISRYYLGQKFVREGED